MQLTGSQIIMECLLEQGVDTVFGYPGGTILNVYDELYKKLGYGIVEKSINSSYDFVVGLVF